MSGDGQKELTDNCNQVPGVHSVHELHIWRLNQYKNVASAHIVVDDTTAGSFTDKARVIMECLHAYGIHSVTLQAEMLPPCDSHAAPAQLMEEPRGSVGQRVRLACQLVCGDVCEGMRCCN